MRRNIFVNRRRELELLENLWRGRNFSLVIIYGRRRVGKTRLILEFARGKKCIFYVAVESSYDAICREFSECARRTLGFPVSGDIIEVLDAAPNLTGEKLLVVLDEFQYIVEADPSFPSRLQRLIDSKLSRQQMMIILCGSAVSFFEEKLLGYKSPLFGRREASLKLSPLRFFQIREFFPNYRIDELITVYGAVGGTPAYLLKLDPSKSVTDNIRSIITPGSYLYDEALNILRQEVREPRTYLSILAAIAEGKNSPGEVASAAHVDVRTITKYIYLLEELDIIERVRPLGSKKPVKLRFRDNYFRFWFRYVYKLRSLLETGLVEEALSHITESLNQYLSQVFEGVVAELVPLMYKVGALKTRPVEVGTWWYKDMEIDLIARDPGKSSTFVEVKWREMDLKSAIGTLKDLERKAARSGLSSPENEYVLVIRRLKGEETPTEPDEHRRILDLQAIERIIEDNRRK